jgi:hypothetical protein
MGNDAMEDMPSCASSGKTSSECGDQLYSSMLEKMGGIIDAVHSANPSAEVVGMGYEMVRLVWLMNCRFICCQLTPFVVNFAPPTQMFGGAGCGIVPASIFPQCWKGEADENDESAIRCFNEQVIRMQAVWDELADQREYVTAINILGLTQMVDGDEKAKVGAPNMEKLGPSWAWPVYEGCIHPGVAGAPKGSGEDSASMIVMMMEEMYSQYWSSQFGC